MRILHLIESLDPSKGGPPEIAASLAAALTRRGHQVTIAANDVSSDSAKRLTDDVPCFDQVRTVLLPPSSNRFPLPARVGSSRVLRTIVREHDVVHFHNVWDKVLVNAAAACTAEGVPYVILVNGMLDRWSLSQRALKKRLAMLTTHRSLLRDATAMQCGNAYERETVERLRLGPRTFIVPNGLWLERIDASRRHGGFRRLHPELADAPFVLFLSRLHHKKGLDYLMDSFDILAGARDMVRLAIAGPDYGELVSLRKRIARSPASDRVHVLGPLYGSEKFAALSECACFCLPSRQEGFPMAVLEALGSGAPVVISEHCHVDDAGTSGAGFVVPLDPHVIAAAIGRVLDTSEAGSSFGRAGRRLVELKYTWPRVAESAEAMYAELVRR